MDQNGTGSGLVPIQKLRRKHRLFVDELFRCNMNATAAYQAVYGASYDSSRANGAKLLANTSIQAEISKRFKERVMGPDEVVFRLSAMSRASQLPFIRFTVDGHVYFDFSHPEAKEYFFLIKKIKTKRTRRVEGHGESAETWEDEWVEVELHDAQTALNTLAKYHNLLTDNSMNYNIDLSSLSDEQLKRLASGESIIDVITNKG